MAVTTRWVVAVLVGTLLLIGLVAPRVDRGVTGSWFLAAGLFGATLWGLSSMRWAQSNPSPLAPTTYLVLSASSAVGAIYFARRGRTGRPPTALDE